MFISSKDYQDAVVSIVNESQELLIAVSFWGEGAENILKEHLGHKKIRIVCNLMSGATNPKTIENIRAQLEDKATVCLRQHSNLHAKVISGDRRAIVGSANLSCNGLNFERNELQGWQEAGIITEDAKHLSSIRKWFEQIWEDSSNITDEDIQIAQNLWSRRRKTRGTRTPRENFSVKNLTIDDLEDREIYLVIYRNPNLSEEGETTFEEIKNNDDDSCYEDWDNFPKNSDLIDIFYGPRGGVMCSGVYEYRLSKTFEREDGSRGRLQTARKIETIMGLRFGKKERDELVKIIKPHMEEIIKLAPPDDDDDDDKGFVINLKDVLPIIKN